jgi:hypothetical protein
LNKTVVAAVAAFLLGSIVTGALLAQSQPAGPPGGLGGPPAADDGPMRRGRMGPGWGMGPAEGPTAGWMRERHERRMDLMRTFALIHHSEDRKLTPPDVQKIAEGFLLWNGNHSWKVINAKAEGDVIGFDLATGDGSVIAHFTMDPHNGALSRVS